MVYKEKFLDLNRVLTVQNSRRGVKENYYPNMTQPTNL